jgi:hypothetical protein
MQHGAGIDVGGCRIPSQDEPRVDGRKVVIELCASKNCHQAKVGQPVGILKDDKYGAVVRIIWLVVVQDGIHDYSSLLWREARLGGQVGFDPKLALPNRVARESPIGAVAQGGGRRQLTVQGAVNSMTIRRNDGVVEDVVGEIVAVGPHRILLDCRSQAWKKDGSTVHSTVKSRRMFLGSGGAACNGSTKT